ncbi:Fic/DOC family N-terminal domain-containing protein [Vibrio splendidus]
MIRLLSNQNFLVRLIPILESKSSSEIENIVATMGTRFKHNNEQLASYVILLSALEPCNFHDKIPSSINNPCEQCQNIHTINFLGRPSKTLFFTFTSK